MNGRLWIPAALAFLAAACGSASPTAQTPTFTHDIAPIVYTNCVQCHRPGQIAPFSLITYDDVREHAAEILQAVESRRMPPWLPDKGRETFENARGLTDGQIQLVRRWVERGAMEGDPHDVPAVLREAEGEWHLGTPDLIVRFPDPYTLSPGDSDEFRNFVVPVPVNRTVFVRGVEFHPGAPASVHHAVIGVDATRESRRLDAEDPAPGYSGMFADEFHSPDGHFVGWTPGRTPSLEPANMAWRLEPGTDLVVQMHMLPGREPVTIQPEIALYFSDRPPQATPFMVKLTTTTIDIPPGATDYIAEDSYTLPVDVDALSIYPHAHYLARDIRATAQLPSGQVIPLLSIADWDFHWQEFYRYAAPVPLPRGTTVSMRIRYDNSSAHQPKQGQAPQRVRYGPRSSDEMGDVWLQVLPRRPAELDTLARDFVARQAEARLRAATRVVRDAPNDAGAHNLLGARMLAVGRVDDAIAELSTALRLDPGSGDAHNNLGAALLAAGRTGEAIPHLRAAVRSRPKDYRVHFNLGNALRDSGRPADAARAFEQALAINPDSAEALNNLAVLDGARGAYASAIARLEHALALKDDYAEAHHNLALALAATGRRDDAVAHVRRALELRPDFATARQTLAELQDR